MNTSKNMYIQRNRPLNASMRIISSAVVVHQIAVKLFKLRIGAELLAFCVLFGELPILLVGDRSLQFLLLTLHEELGEEVLDVLDEEASAPSIEAQVHSDRVGGEAVEAQSHHRADVLRIDADIGALLFCLRQ